MALRCAFQILTTVFFCCCSGSVKAEPAGVDILGRPLKDRHVADGGPTSKRQLLDVLLEGYDLDKWPTFPDDNADNGQCLRNIPKNYIQRIKRFLNILKLLSETKVYEPTRYIMV